jgi:DNA repair exonuclease SbcCD ATPase subunit
MALADRGRRNGWHHQATSLVSSHSALGTTAKALVDRSGPLLRRRPLLEAQDQEVDSASEEIGIELARKLDEARAEIARLELRLSHDAAAAQELRAQIKASAAATEAADQRAAGLAREIAAARGGLQENIDLLTAENARLLQGHAERGMALDDAQDKIKFLENALAAAEAASVSKQAETLANGARAARVEFQEQLDLAAGENARLQQTIAEKDVAFGEVRARIEFLQTALSTAEAECSRLGAEVGCVRQQQHAESETLNGRLEAMSIRAVTAEKLLAEARERLLARIVESGAFRQKVADAKAAADKAYAKTRQLEDAVTLRQHQIDELERSRATLVEATTTLLETFEDRDRALQRAQQKIKALAERNAELEAKANRVGEFAGQKANAGQDGKGAKESVTIADLSSDGADQSTRTDWSELARLLTDFVERKRQSPGHAQRRSMTLLASTMTF